MDRNDVEITGTETCHDGFFRVERVRLRHRRFAGGWTDELTREVVRRRAAVAMLPYDPAGDRVVLIEQFRAGAQAAGREPWMVEIPAGLVEPDETLDEVARRETREETGLEPDALRRIATLMTTPGGFDEVVTVYCVRIGPGEVDGVHGAPDEGEDIRVFAVPADDALAMVEDGRIENALAIIALQWLALHRAGLRAEWTAAPSGEATRSG